MFDADLGSIVFERKPSKTEVLFLRALGIALAAIGCFTVAIVSNKKNAAEWPLAIGGLCGVGIGIALVFLASRIRGKFRCHEHGISLSGLLRDRQLRFDELSALTHKATQVYVNGAYTYSHVRLTFSPNATSQASAISVRWTFVRQDSDLNALIGSVGELIADKLQASLLRDGEVSWMSGVVFRDTGLEYPKMGFLRKKTGFVAYDQIAGFDGRQTTRGQANFFLMAAGSKSPILRFQPSAANFIPGLILLGRLAQHLESMKVAWWRLL